MKKLISTLILPILLYTALLLEISAFTTFVLCMVWFVVFAGILAVMVLSKIDTEIAQDIIPEHFVNFINDQSSRWGFLRKLRLVCIIACNTTLLILINAPITAFMYMAVSGCIILAMDGIIKSYDKFKLKGE